MKKLSKEKAGEFYNSLQKKRNWIKARSLLLAMFVLGVNVFAWFVFVSKADVQVNANVVAWDVNFTDDNNNINNIVVETPKLYPGMPTYTKRVDISNRSEMPVEFTYQINSVDIMGKEVMTELTTQDEINTYLEESFPFVVTFKGTKTDLDIGESMSFTINIDWPLEKEDTKAREYYRLTEQYKYDPTVFYYSLTDGVYNKEDITEGSFETNKTNLYLEKDDADSFWGANCQAFREENGKSCFSFKLLLKVSQKSA